MTPFGVGSSDGGGGGGGGTGKLVSIGTSRALAPQEQEELDQQERVISKGMSTFLEVGNALMTIRTKRLYRATHSTFEHYCKQKWGFTKTSANRYISASSVVEDIRGITPLVPTSLSESQLRPLTLLKAADRQKVWKAVINEMDESKVPRRITANLITKKIREVVPHSAVARAHAAAEEKEAKAAATTKKSAGSAITMLRREEAVESVASALDKWYARNKKAIKAAEFSKLKAYLTKHI